MPRIESYAPGSFCWAELATTDADAAKHFYGEIFGWTATDIPMPEGVYTLFQAEGNDAAGLFTAHPGMPVHWGVHFSVASVDETAARIAPGGGTLAAGPFDAHDVGRMAVGQDPQGATFTLWQAKRSIGATHGGPLGRVMWPELATPDPGAAAAFYTSLLGWTTKPAAGVADTPYTEWVNQGVSFGGLLPMRGEEWKGIPPHWLVYITVANCDERTERAAALGAKVCVPPREIPNVGRFAVLNDPQGASFSLIQMQQMALTA